MRLAPALMLSQLWVCMAAAEAPDKTEGLAWLQKIAAAAGQLNYSGIFVYQHGEQVETSRITHFVDHGSEYEKLETLDGPKREIIRNSNEILTYFADTLVIRREKRTVRKAFPALLPEQLTGVTEHYQLRKGGHERIAGYDAQALVLDPRDEFRYGHKLWAEGNTGLLLKARMLDERKHAVEQFQFTEVSINGPLTRDSVKPSFNLPPEESLQEGSSEPALPSDTGWIVRNPPPGFKKIMEMQRPKHGGHGHVAHLVFSDGLAAVSVFVEPMPAARVGTDGLSHQGAVNIFTRSLPEHLVTVLGETPAVTVMQIANSVSPKTNR
jgi:sigma-E factor negative regulatory protein RseB